MTLTNPLIKLIIFVICTLFSCLPIMILIKEVWLNPLAFLMSKEAEIAFWLFRIMFILVITIAWLLYFVIGYHWVKHGAVSKPLKRYGLLFGFSAVALVLLIPAVIALPAILLMLYIDYFVPDNPNQL